tara:strand:- start:1750 stop:2427 length:678 start_codon:yes stop_codon:yes gene_type:complete
MAIQGKGLFGYAYPEVTNILMGQSPFDLLYSSSTTKNFEWQARRSADFEDKSITAFADGPSGDASDTTFTVTSHGLQNGDFVTIEGTTNYNIGSTKISGVTEHTFVTASNYTSETPGAGSKIYLNPSSVEHLYIEKTSSFQGWNSLKVASWNSTTQLIGAKLQARCIEGFPGDDFCLDGTYDNGTIGNNLSLVAGDSIPGFFDRVAILGTAVGNPSSVMATRTSL